MDAGRDARRADRAEQALAELERAVVANAGRYSRQGERLRWLHVMDATGAGATEAVFMCQRAGFDQTVKVGTDDPPHGDGCECDNCDPIPPVQPAYPRSESTERRDGDWVQASPGDYWRHPSGATVLELSSSRGCLYWASASPGAPAVGPAATTEDAKRLALLAARADLLKRAIAEWCRRADTSLRDDIEGIRAFIVSEFDGEELYVGAIATARLCAIMAELESRDR